MRVYPKDSGKLSALFFFVEQKEGQSFSQKWTEMKGEDNPAGKRQQNGVVHVSTLLKCFNFSGLLSYFSKLKCTVVTLLLNL